ncbi:hypothetical protein PoB_007132400 [Plakobranchus ocellatus]|uniref:Uncharacterized protein n=1 Tax=Plakobranchus ocellatus TaxID=259542 RepID=A0AAV4DL97_9GAST|nr:hypothetical protein PoB_007132400 [Plakobranchus ocellatus]
MVPGHVFFTTQQTMLRSYILNLREVFYSDHHVQPKTSPKLQRKSSPSTGQFLTFHKLSSDPCGGKKGVTQLTISMRVSTGDPAYMCMYTEAANLHWIVLLSIHASSELTS